MAAGEKQKQKLLLLAQLFFEKTDEKHHLTTQEIISHLQSQDVNVERKTLYTDMQELRDFGLDLLSKKVGRETEYYLCSRDFELAELKLLVDSVQSAKFITEKKSRQLIKKIEGLTSCYEAGELQRQVYVTGRAKTSNENVLYNVDEIHNAINNQRQIQFQYFQWDHKKQQCLRHEGKVYEVSPWALICDKEKYYMLGFDAQANCFKHYRVDKMLRIKESAKPREGIKEFQKFDLAVYTQKMFGMYHGEHQNVKLRVHNSLAGVIIDQFGLDVMMIPDDNEHFLITMELAISQQLIGWLVGLSTEVEVLEPESLRQKMKELGENLWKQYSD